MGVRNLGTMTARWAGADNFQLRRTGDLAAEDISHAKAENDIALYALMPSLTDDDSPVAFPRDATRFITNADCNGKSSYGWTATNVDYKTDAEAYDAVATNTYWNIWKSGAYTSTMKQEIHGLPEGTYTFSALLRGQDTATLTLTAATTSTNGSRSFTGKGTADGADYPQGWNLITTTPVQVKSGETLTLTLEAKCTATAWWSADHFTLTLNEIPEVRVSINDLAQPESPAPSTLNPQPSTLFDLSGRPVRNHTPQKGLYIIRSTQGGASRLMNGRKVLFK